VEATETLKKRAGEHCQRLLDELTVEKLRKNKRTETARLGIQQHCRALDHFRDYCQVGLSNELECGSMPNVMAALPNIGGAVCSTPQILADAHY